MMNLFFLLLRWDLLFKISDYKKQFTDRNEIPVYMLKEIFLEHNSYIQYNLD